MVYTSGVITDLTREETLEELQDNKLTIVCEKVSNVFLSLQWPTHHKYCLEQLNLTPEDHLLDIGCGWGTLSAFAHKNYGCKVTGVTLAKNQTAFGNERIASNVSVKSVVLMTCLIPSNSREVTLPRLRSFAWMRGTFLVARVPTLRLLAWRWQKYVDSMLPLFVVNAVCDIACRNSSLPVFPSPGVRSPR